MEWKEYAQKIRYGENDVPDKYGWTKKMHDIYDLVEEEKTLDDADFQATKYDVDFYEGYKWEYDRAKEQNGGKPFHVQRYIVDIDPD